MEKIYKQQELFEKTVKVKKIKANFDIELEDGTILKLTEEDARKIYEGLNKMLANKGYPIYPYYTIGTPNYIPTYPNWTGDGAIAVSNTGIINMKDSGYTQGSISVYSNSAIN